MKLQLKAYWKNYDIASYTLNEDFEEMKKDYYN